MLILLTKETDFERNKLEKQYQHLIEVNPLLNRGLVSFQASKKTPFYGWFGFKEAFSPDMVKLFISEYHKKSGRLLDPFAGTGTSLFSASEMGFDSVGIELLPIGDFVLKTRQIAQRIDPDELLKKKKEIERIDFHKYPVSKDIVLSHLAITKGAFPIETARKIDGFLNYSEEEPDEELRHIMKFALFSILERISYTRKDGQYLHWDKRAGKGRGEFDKGDIPAFEKALSDQLNKMLLDLNNRRLFFDKKDIRNNQKITLRTGSCLEIMPTLEDESFDLIVSSPPYCNRYDYTRTYALELAFLGIDEDRLKQLRQELLSCTVENKDKQAFLRKIYQKNDQLSLFEEAERTFNSVGALTEVLGLLEQYRDEGKLNNPGIYRMVRSYFYEHSMVIHQMARLLKRAGRVYYVNDNVMYAGEYIPVDLILSEFAKKSGLQVSKIYKLGNGKGNSSQQMGLHGRRELRKCVYLWEKN